MPKNLLRRYLPTAATLRKQRSLRWLGSWLTEPEIWHLHRRAVAGAAFIGLFCAFLPIPFQMVPAAFLAVVSRCNLPMSVALVWISNPITMPPMFYFAYRLGALILGMDLQASSIEISFDWLVANLGQIGYPLIVGSVVCGWVAGLTGFVFVHLAWRLSVVRRWRARRERRRQNASGRPV